MVPHIFREETFRKILRINKKFIHLQSHYGKRGVAQLASASGLGPEGPVFESQYPDLGE